MSSGGSNGLLRQGAVSQKAVFGSKQRKYLYLVFPRDIDHLKSLHGDILAGSDKKEKDNKSTELLGNLSFSAINGNYSDTTFLLCLSYYYPSH